MVFIKRHLLSNSPLVEALQLPIPFEHGTAWLAQLIRDKAFIFETTDNRITSISSIDSSVTIKETGWIVKKEDDKIWLLSDERMNNFYAYAPGNATSEYVNLSATFNSVAAVKDTPVESEKLQLVAAVEDTVVEEPQQFENIQNVNNLQSTEEPPTVTRPARIRRATKKVEPISQDL